MANNYENKYEVLLQRFKEREAENYVRNYDNDPDERLCWIVEGDKLIIVDMGQYLMKPRFDTAGVPYYYEFHKTHDAYGKEVVRIHNSDHTAEEEAFREGGKQMLEEIVSNNPELEKQILNSISSPLLQT